MITAVTKIIQHLSIQSVTVFRMFVTTDTQNSPEEHSLVCQCNGEEVYIL